MSKWYKPRAAVVFREAGDKLTFPKRTIKLAEREAEQLRFMAKQRNSLIELGSIHVIELPE